MIFLLHLNYSKLHYFARDLFCQHSIYDSTCKKKNNLKKLLYRQLFEQDYFIDDKYLTLKGSFKGFFNESKCVNTLQQGYYPTNPIYNYQSLP
jgi:hypothetical protein